MPADLIAISSSQFQNWFGRSKLMMFIFVFHLAYSPPQRLAVSGTKCPGIERAWRIEHQRCEPLLGRTRFSVLLTITRDPYKLEGRKFDRR